MESGKGNGNELEILDGVKNIARRTRNVSEGRVFTKVMEWQRWEKCQKDKGSR
jgi:hypothetical protein